MRRTVLLTIMTLLAGAASLPAQTGWQLSGQIRQRFEVDGKDFDKSTQTSSFNLLRSRLNVTFTPGENVTGFFQLQDSRTFGEESGTMDGQANAFDLHQGYFQLARLFDLPVDLKVGRMEVNYGPERLIGAVDWSNIGRSFDGAILNVHGKRFSMDLFNFKEVEGSQPGDDLDVNVLGVYVDVKLADGQTTQLFTIRQRQLVQFRQDLPGRLDRYTVGLYAQGSLGPVIYEAELAQQGGKGGTSSSNKVDASMAALNVGFDFSFLPFRPILFIGVDYLSGDDDLGDQTAKWFDTLYATNHKYYGFMDYFPMSLGYLGLNTLSLGLTDIHVKLAIQPLESTKIKVAFHSFRLSQDYTLTDGSTTRDLLNEIDLTVNHRYSANVSFVGGVSLAMPGDFVKTWQGEDNATWAYLMTVVNF